MDPIEVREEDARLFYDMQKSVQKARLAFERDRAKELEGELRRKIYELYPQTAGLNVRFDVSAQKIFVWEVS